jgi:hypothetical protein
MADDTQLLYLEPDDEITTVVRRLREADSPRVVLVATGRSKATTSAVALRLLAQVAAEEGRHIALVADAGGRALAAEAGIPAFASVADANAEGAVPLEPAPAQRAPIHVVRGEPEPAAPSLPAGELTAAPVTAPRGMEETQAVPVQRPANYPVPRAPAPAPTPARRPRPARPRAARRLGWMAAGVALLLLVGAGAALGVVLPSATITIRPQALPVGPISYQVRPEMRTPDAPQLTSTQPGEATGRRLRRTPASGVVTLYNYSDENVFAPSGTVVSVGGDILFQTTTEVVVPDSFFGFAGTANVEVVASDPGPAGNVEAFAIDTIEDRDVDRALRGPGPDNRRIENLDPTSGGEAQELHIVRKADIDAVREAITNDLRQQLAEQRDAAGEERIYTRGAPRPVIEVPDDLQGHASVEPFTFELTGTLQDDQPYVLAPDADAAAKEAILTDEEATPAGATIDFDTVQVELGSASTQDGEIVVQAVVTAEAVPDFDPSAIAGQVAGRTKRDAEQRLSSIGEATVTFWPFWVDRVPSLEWRVSVDVQAVEPVESIQP